MKHATAATWTDLEVITLSAVAGRRHVIICYPLCVGSKKRNGYKWTHLQKRNRFTQRTDCGYQAAVGWERGGVKFGIQFSLVAQLCPALCELMDYSTSGFPVHHQLPELAQTHVHGVADAIQPSHPPSPPAFSLSQHQRLFHWVSSSHQVAKVLEFQLQHQSFQWMFRTDLL